MRAVLSLADVDGDLVKMLREGLELPDSDTPTTSGTTGGSDKLDEGSNAVCVARLWDDGSLCVRVRHVCARCLSFISCGVVYLTQLLYTHRLHFVHQTNVQTMVHRHSSITGASVEIYAADPGGNEPIRGRITRVVIKGTSVSSFTKQ
jgi:hypothetical protein